MPRMSGIDALMAVLDAQDVDYVFGNPGSTEVVFMDALYQHPKIKYILALHETVATGMAGGYSWASGKAGVINVHTAPGVANLVSALYNAYVSDFNLVVTAGQQDTRLIQREPGLTGDLVAMTRPYTKWSTEVQHPAYIPLVMHRAFKISSQQPQGPTFVSLPQDVLSREAEIEVGYPSWVPSEYAPDKKAIEKAAELLAQARNPALFVGFRLARCDALKEAVALAELIGARVTENRLRAETAFPSDHPLFGGGMSTDVPGAHKALEDVDVVLAVGANFISQTFYLPEPLVSPSTRVIHLDTDPWEVGKNQPTDVGIVADIKLGLQELISAVSKQMSPGSKKAARERVKQISDENHRRREALWERAQESWDQEPISDIRLMLDLKECLPADAILVDGGVTASVALRDHLDFTEPDSYLAFRDNDGSLGDSLPMALGVKLGQPDRPVVGVIGDGNAMYSIQALWTAAHHRIPVTLVICNNSSYRILKLNTMRVLGREARDKLHSVDLADPPLDFASLAQSFGVHAERVVRPRDIKPALERAINLDEPALVDVVIDPAF